MVTEQMRIDKAIECLQKGEVLAAKDLITNILFDREYNTHNSYEEAQEAAFHDQLP